MRNFYWFLCSPGIAFLAMPVGAERALVRVGEVQGIEPELVKRGLDEFLKLTDSKHKELLREWELELREHEAPQAVDITKDLGLANGNAFEEGHILISHRNASDKVRFMFVLEHEWLGHKLNNRLLLRITGEKLSGVGDELVARIRGWRLWLRLDPKAACQDWELIEFIKLGPKAYLDSLIVPNRTYAMMLSLEEMGKPEAALAARIEKIQDYLKKLQEPRKPPEPEEPRDDHWKRMLSVRSSSAKSIVDSNGLGKTEIVPVKPLPNSLQAPSNEDFHISKEENDFYSHRIEVAQKLLMDAKIMAKYKRIAANPDVRSLVAQWDHEIIDFCTEARKEFGMAEARCE